MIMCESFKRCLGFVEKFQLDFEIVLLFRIFFKFSHTSVMLNVRIAQVLSFKLTIFLCCIKNSFLAHNINL